MEMRLNLIFKCLLRIICLATVTCKSETVTSGSVIQRHGAGLKLGRWHVSGTVQWAYKMKYPKMTQE